MHLLSVGDRHRTVWNVTFPNLRPLSSGGDQPKPDAFEVGASALRHHPHPRVIWCFGRSGAGKTTIAAGLVEQFRAHSIATLHLDGESVRSGLSVDLGFSNRDRAENHRRIAEFAMIARQQGVQVVVSTMAPLRVHRDTVESVLPNSVCWIHVDSSPAVCEARDPKLLYRRARDGRIPDFLDFPFEAPEGDEKVWSVSTESMSPKESIQILWNRLQSEPCEPG